MYGDVEGISHAYWMCLMGMAEKVREAIACGDIPRLIRLLDDGVKPLPDENGISPLQKAAAEGHVEIVQILLKYGADISHQDSIHGNSALHEAAWRGYSKTIAILAKALGNSRGPLNARNFTGFAPLHLACQNGHNQTCRELLLAGCNPDLQNNYGDTPIHTSARYGHAGVTRILISALCRISDQNKNGDTALHIAAAMARRKLTRILLEAGCDKNLRNKQNETAKDIARRKNLSEILNIINKSKKKSRSRSNSRDDELDKPDKEKSEVKNKSCKKHWFIGNKGTEHRKSGRNQNKVHFEKDKQWSPYGCHYYPDPEAFPSPKLDSLPSDPLKQGEQYYLDLAGNIRKGPVGVGYTCYCAPFFRNMEAKLERDKAELRAHIEQAHKKLDLKVAHLEKRTRGQISELTKCVIDEKIKCEEKHENIKRLIQRGGHGRHSERPNRKYKQHINPIRAKSLEDLLDERLEDRSFEIPGEISNFRSSLDNLDIPAIPRLCKSLKNLFTEDNNNSLTKSNDINKHINEMIFDDGVNSRTSPLGKSASPTISLKYPQLKNQNVSEIFNDNQLDNSWKNSTSRKNVHEIIKRFQQVPDFQNNWRGKKSVNNNNKHLSTSLDNQSSSQRIQPQGISFNNWNPENQAQQLEVKNDELNTNQSFDNCAETIAQNSRFNSVNKMPYQSKNVMYSAQHDTHNDSGYSTKMYGSSKGPSPSLSDDILLQSQNLIQQSRHHELGADNLVISNINIGTSSTLIV